MRKMLVAMAKDWRVLVIKLADRLHNMRTLSVMPEWKQRRTAQETLGHLRPAGAPPRASRRSSGSSRTSPSRPCTRSASPRSRRWSPTRAPRREVELDRGARGRCAAGSARLGIEAEVTGRPKHLWSIYEKMVVRGKEFDEIHDLVGDPRDRDRAEKDCWAALGAVHALWPPVQGRFKDYINSPKFNLYQSLHTTVVGPRVQAARDPDPDPRDAPACRVRDRRPLGLQGGGRQARAAGSGPASADEIAWLQRIVDWERETPDPDRVPGDAEARPRAGRGVRLHAEGPDRHLAGRARPRSTSPTRSTPRSGTAASAHGSTAACSRSTRSCTRATRSRSSPPRSPSAGPSRDWLQIVASPRARNKIRQWFSRERREDAIETGREELARGARRGGLPVQKLQSSPALVGRGGVDGLRRSRRAPRRDRRGPRLGHRRSSSASSGSFVAARARSSCPRRRCSRGGRATRRGLDGHLRRGPRRRDGPARPAAARRCRATGSSASSPAVGACRCTGRTARTRIALAADEKERLIEVEWDEDRTGVFVAGDRGEGARPQPAAGRRRQGALRAPREHHLLVDPHDAG